MQEIMNGYMAEEVARDLLNQEKSLKRSLGDFKQRLGIAEDQELRKILVRAGAVRFIESGGQEMWGLVSANES